MDKQPTSRSCFLCGRQNNTGLKMTWFNDYDAQQVFSEIIIPEDFNGYPGVVHGGIVAALLDETAGRSLMLDGDHDGFFITTKLEVKYHFPTPTGQVLRVIGWVIRRTSRFARVGAEIRLPDGTVTAICEAAVARPPRKFFELTDWDHEKQYWKVTE